MTCVFFIEDQIIQSGELESKGNPWSASWRMGI